MNAGAQQRGANEPQRVKLLAECSIKLRCDRNLDPRRHDLPNMRISGDIANVDVSITHAQYELVMGMLGAPPWYAEARGVDGSFDDEGGRWLVALWCMSGHTVYIQKDGI